MSKLAHGPKGFKSGAIALGIRKCNRFDYALIYSDCPATAAGTFTQNKMKASCVKVSQECVERGKLQAILINSGNANACTGQQGETDTRTLIQSLSEELNIPEQLVTMSSTGVIGSPLPVEKMKGSIPSLVESLSPESHMLAARAIMTTDTFPKTEHIGFQLDGIDVSIQAIAKGSGMIHPNMATMLCFIMTDVHISHSIANRILRQVVNETFNMISVDGDCSTNDMVLLLANGMAQNSIIQEESDPRVAVFEKHLYQVCEKLGREIARDGEGATKLLEFFVEGAKNTDEAKRIARGISLSPLVKTAMFGNEANWGRIACAIGNSDATIDENHLSIWLNQTPVFIQGKPTDYDEKLVTDSLKNNEIFIRVSIGIGNGQAKAWGCDLSPEYVRINGAYKS